VKAKTKDVGNRLTGFSTPIFGLQWSTTPSQREIVEELFDRLSDRRVLYNAYEAEVVDHCIESILQIRSILTELIAKLRGRNATHDHLRAIRASCREFLDRVGQLGRHYGGLGHSMEFNSALGELRGRVGVHLALLSVEQDVSVPSELVAILPPEINEDTDD
jgi:hypothetical protein